MSLYLFIDWQASLVFGVWLCTMWIVDHCMKCLEFLHYIYILQSISVHYVLCRMWFCDKSYSKKNVFYAANLYAVGRYYWLWGTYSMFFWYVWQLKVNLHDIRNVWVRWNSSIMDCVYMHYEIVNVCWQICWCSWCTLLYRQFHYSISLEQYIWIIGRICVL